MEDIFYDPEIAKKVNYRNLPHWQQPGKMYFVTFRLADSIPQSKLMELDKERQQYQRQNLQPYSKQEEEYRRLFSKKVEAWLDDGYGECLLALPSCREIVQNALEFYNEQKYKLDYWVIMPNHVHVLMIILKDHELKEILHGWKSYTANQINKVVNRKGQLWQHESFDHIVRSALYLDKYRKYIIENTNKAGGRAICKCRSSISG